MSLKFRARRGPGSFAESAAAKLRTRLPDRWISGSFAFRKLRQLHFLSSSGKLEGFPR
jgi:hypothetical protein